MNKHIPNCHFKDSGCVYLSYNVNNLKCGMKPIYYDKQLLTAGSIFTVHNIEEAIGFAYFTYPKHLPLPMAPSAKPMILSIILVTIIAWAVIFWALKRKNETASKNLLTALIAVFLVNAILPHIAGTLLLGQYFPAAVSAVVLYLPYSCWMFPKLRREYLTKKHFYTTMTIGLLISFLLVILVQVISSLIINQ